MSEINKLHVLMESDKDYISRECFSRYCCGVIPVCFLNQLQKYGEVEK